jgi:hypothetical protein
MESKGKAIAVAIVSILSPFTTCATEFAKRGFHSVPLIPSPEPETLSLMILGVALIAGGVIARSWHSRNQD